jgi:TfdA family taurine catabolism dioxygenase TauD
LDWTSFPDAARVKVPPSLADALMKRTGSLPLYDNKEFYSSELQARVHQSIRESSPEGFDWLVATIRERLTQRPYCALVTGLSFDEGNRVFVAINRAFGELVARPYEKPRAQLVHYIQPATDIPSARGGHESERLHTDTADWEDPVELISMICVRPDAKGGGRSRLLDVDTLRQEVKNRLGVAVLDLLESEPVPWQLAPYLGGGLSWQTVLTRTSVRWRRYTINLALESEGIELADEVQAGLEAFEEVIGTSAGTIDFLMREHDFLISNNTRTIHARTPITDGIGSDRMMIRSWIRSH